MPSDSRILQASYRHCRRISRRSHSSFCVGFALLPGPKRQSMHALYAFLRHADDLVDAPAGIASPDSSGDERRQQIEALRTRLQQALQKNSDPPASADQLQTACGTRIGDGERILPALADTVERFQIPHESLFAVLDGMIMDLDKNRYATFAELRQYCERVASAVGVACVHIWGFHGRGAAVEPVLDLARQVGIALQLTNILRDLKEDDAADRIYLPIEDFRTSGYSPEELLRGKATPGFQRLVQSETVRAEEFYRAARSLYALLKPEGRRIFGLMVTTYHTLLEKIARRPDVILKRRIRLSRFQRLRLVLRWWLFPPPAAEDFSLHY